MARRKNYLSNFKLNETPQNEAIPGTVPNSAGGYSFEVDKWGQLERFLILGSEGGTYYISEQKLTRDNAKSVLKCIKEDGLRVVKTVLDISKSGRAPKNTPALFVHALASVEGDEKTRKLAFDTLSEIARIGTHLFQWVEFRKNFGGFGSGVRRAISDWYTSKDASKLGYQLIKYKQRNGWTHLDVLRLAHVKPVDAQYDALFALAKSWAKKTKPGDVVLNALPAQVHAAEKMADTTKKGAIKLITDFNLPREVVPTEFLNDPEVWEALLENMPMTAMIRNLGNMTKVGLLKPMSKASKKVVDELKDRDRILKARVHPVQVLAALKTYGSGCGFRGTSSWTPVATIVDALDDAFYTAFDTVEPTGKNFLLGLDVSGSMSWGNVAGLDMLTPAEAAACMAMVTARTEQNYHIMGFADTFRNLKVTAKDSLESAIKKTSDQNFGGTDCALPMTWALEKGIDVDAFVVLTDSETWYGKSHPSQALNRYRQKKNINSKLIIIAMTGNRFSIADPSDAGMMDFVGFDSSAPRVLADFVKT